jgi:hypothetical protein
MSIFSVIARQFAVAALQLLESYMHFVASKAEGGVIPGGRDCWQKAAAGGDGRESPHLAQTA